MQEVKGVPAFGCCAFWQVCDLGVKPCVHAEKNLVKREACGAFKKAQRITTCTEVQKEEIEVVQPVSPVIGETNFDHDADGQLTLF